MKIDRRHLKQVLFRCKACGADLTKTPWHVDHVHPKSRGGSEKPENFQILCASCNTSKGAKTMEEWAPWLMTKGRPIVNWGELGWIPPTSPEPAPARIRDRPRRKGHGGGRRGQHARRLAKLKHQFDDAGK